MATVSEFIKRKDRKKFSAPTMALPLPETLIGVEVEIDQDAHTRAVFPEDYQPEWEQKHDGSLSNGYEYVMSSPLSGQAAVNAIYKLYQEPTEVGRTYTGSTHIHVDMLDSVDLDALRTLVLLTYAFESVLYAAGDMSRQWCGYANRLSSAPSEMIEQIMTLDDFSNFRGTVGNNSRYYGLNLQALTKYGSAEFRYFPTAESAEELLRWVKLVQLFKKAAIEIGSSDKLIDLLSSEEGYNDFVATYFSEYAAEVAAAGGYEKIKSLMTKALIISKTAKGSGKRFSNKLLTGRFQKVVERARKKLKAIKLPENFRLNIQVSARGSGAPAATAAVREYVNEHGVQPDLTVLLHTTGSLYYARQLRSNSEQHDWEYASDIPGSSPQLMETFLAATPVIIQYIEAHPEITWHANTIANVNNAHEFIQDAMNAGDFNNHDDEEF